MPACNRYSLALEHEDISLFCDLQIFWIKVRLYFHNPVISQKHVKYGLALIL